MEENNKCVAWIQIREKILSVTFILNVNVLRWYFYTWKVPAGRALYCWQRQTTCLGLINDGKDVAAKLAWVQNLILKLDLFFLCLYFCVVFITNISCSDLVFFFRFWLWDWFEIIWKFVFVVTLHVLFFIFIAIFKSSF
jgi:hypothetical protein